MKFFFEGEKKSFSFKNRLYRLVREDENFLWGARESGHARTLVIIRRGRQTQAEGLPPAYGPGGYSWRVRPPRRQDPLYLERGEWE
jgi:hypothetical protein